MVGPVPSFTYGNTAPALPTSVVVGPLAPPRGWTPAPGGFLLVERAVDAVAGDALRALTRGLIDGPADPLVVDGGERVKDPAQILDWWRACAARGLERGSLLVVAGGGALLDAGAFLAATWLRGVRVALVPTTLLAQVDAALGGKCGLNLDGVKNQVGLIRQPELILADPAWLTTLPAGAFRSGLGEVAKTALLAGGELWEMVLRDADRILARDAEVLAAVVLSCLRYKASIVARDPLERGERALLNAGHTAGHVLEAAALAQGLSIEHGDAVAIGLRCEAAAVPDADHQAVTTILARLRLAERPPVIPSLDVWRALLARDKKRVRSDVLLPVVMAPGRVELRSLPIEGLGAAFCDSLRQ